MPKIVPWNSKIEEQICEDIESGLTLRAVAEKNNVSKALILKKVKDSKSFHDQYTRAIEARTETDFEGLADTIAEKPAYSKGAVDSGWVNWKRLQIDTIKWALSKRNPKKYGEKVEHSGEIGVKRVVSDL